MFKQNNELHFKYQRVSAVITTCQAFRGSFSAIVTLNTNLWMGQILSFSETSHQSSPDLL